MLKFSSFCSRIEVWCYVFGPSSLRPGISPKADSLTIPYLDRCAGRKKEPVLFVARCLCPYPCLIRWCPFVPQPSKYAPQSCLESTIIQQNILHGAGLLCGYDACLIGEQRCIFSCPLGCSQHQANGHNHTTQPSGQAVTAWVLGGLVQSSTQPTCSLAKPPLNSSDALLLCTQLCSMHIHRFHRFHIICNLLLHPFQIINYSDFLLNSLKMSFWVYKFITSFMNLDI